MRSARQSSLAAAVLVVVAACGSAPGGTPAPVEATVEFRSLRGIATTGIEVDARGFHAELGNTVTISGCECDGYTGLWPLIFARTVSEEGASVVFDGTLGITVKTDLSATYSLDVRNVAEGLPMLTAELSFVGGAAVFVDDPVAPRIDLLDGEPSAMAEGSGTRVSISGIVIGGTAGHASVPVIPYECATTTPG